MDFVLTIIVIVIAVLGMIISPILAVRIIREKGHDTSLWGLFGFFAGALAVIAAACMKDKKSPQEVVLISDQKLLERQEREKEEAVGKTEFDSATQKIVCPVCGKEFEIDRSTDETECPYCGKKLKRKK